MSARDVIAIVEAGYGVEDSEQLWLKRTLDAARPHLFDRMGGVACFFDRRISDPKAVMFAVEVDGMDPRIITIARREFERGDDAERARSLQGGPIVRLSAICGAPLKASTPYGSLAHELDFNEVIGIRADNPDGTGVFYSAVHRDVMKNQRAFDARWSRIAVHLAAGARLQKAAQKLAYDGVGCSSTDRTSLADAVLSPAGGVLSASGPATTATEALRRAARMIDRARSRAGRKDPDAALDGWTALVEGRWSLIDQFESDGKRFVLALENTPSSPDPRVLTGAERPIAHYAAMGHSNKLIAYELGLPEGTVATRMLSILSKLGVRSRVELIDRFVMMKQASFAEADIAGAPVLVGVAKKPLLALDKLTAAENEVAMMAARGLQSSAIAKKRGCSPRTVANLLANAYRKLGVSSRSELARLCGGHENT